MLYDDILYLTGKRTAVTKNRRKADGSLSTASFAWTFDHLGRLTGENYIGPGIADDYNDSYSLDLVGNHLIKVHDPLPGSNHVATTIYTYDANDRIHTESLRSYSAGWEDVTYTYGADGAAVPAAAASAAETP